MNFRSPRRSGTGWPASISVLAIVLTANWLGAFNAPDLQIHDLFQRFATRASEEADAVLLVECPPAMLTHDHPLLHPLLNLIGQASPTAIGVVSERAALELGSLRDGLPCPLVEGRPANQILENEPIPTGFAELSFAPQPVLRFADHTTADHTTADHTTADHTTADHTTADHTTADHTTDGQGGRIHSFESLLSKRQPQSAAPIGIRFGSSIHAIPRISAAQILEQNFLPEMIRGRVVIVGEDSPSSAGVFAPIGGVKKLPKLEARAHTLLSLMGGDWYRKSGPLTSGVYLLAFWLTLHFLCRRLGTKKFVWATTGYNFAALTVAIISSHFAAILLPVSAALTLSSLLPLWLWLERFQSLSNSITSQSGQLKAQLATTLQRSGDDPWQQIGPALKQYYPIKRLALLEIDPTKKLLSPVSANGTVDESALHAHRRDISRAPWQQSFELGKACRNTSVAVFKPTNQQNAQAENLASASGDVEFIVPLKFGSKILGLIVLEVAQPPHEESIEFERVVNQIAQEFASQIAHQRSGEDRSPAGTFSTPEQTQLTEMQRQQNRLATSTYQILQAFESDSCCRALFDATGTALQVNARMLRRLGDEKPSGNANALDMIAQLATLSPPEARRIFRESMLRQRRNELPAAAGPGALPGAMVLSPITFDADAGRDIFSQGLLIEIFDLSGSGESMPEEQVLRDVQDLVKTTQRTGRAASTKCLEATLQSAVFNAEPWVQRRNQQIEKSFQCETHFPAGTCEAIGRATEICLWVLSECTPESETISIAMPACTTNSAQKIQIYNGNAAGSPQWPSPAILTQHSVEHLEEVNQKLREIGGQVNFLDGFNSQVVVSIDLPPNAVSANAATLAGESQRTSNASVPIANVKGDHV